MGTGLELESFYRALWKDQVGFAELRLIDGKGGSNQIFFKWPDELTQFISVAQQHSGKTNVYYGVCLRSRKGGKAADVAQAPAVWVDVDFKVTPRQKIEDALKTFPVRASLGVMSGGGYHVYWLLKEPSTEFEKIVTINRQLVMALGADIKSTDIARILRVPSTLNIKYAPPVECQTVVLRPERLYEFSNFEFLPPLADPPIAVTTQPQEGGSFPAPPTMAPGESLPGEKYEIPDLLMRRLAKLAQFMWKPGHRHAAALFLSGMLGKTGVKRESVRKLIESVCVLTADEELQDRLRTVEDTYRDLAADPSLIGGSMHLQKAVIEQLPAEIQYHANQAMKAIQASIKTLKQEEDDRTADLKVTRISKLDSRPAIWETTVLTRNKEYTIRSSTKEQLDFLFFRDMFWEEHHFFLPVISQSRWEKLLEEAPIEVQRVDKAEGTITGYLQQTILDFEAKAHGEKSIELSIQSVPVKTDQGEVMLKLPALMRFLKSEELGGRKRPEVISALKALHYEDKLIWIGKERHRVWVKNGKQIPGQEEQNVEPNQGTLSI